MIDTAPHGYARVMAAVTPRKLWQANPGDCVVLLAPCDHGFRDYVEQTLGLDLTQVDIVAPEQVRGVHALNVVADLDAADRVAARPTLAPFVVDAAVTAFAADRDLRVYPYQFGPSTETLAAIREINTKSGFRRIASLLGLPVADGGHARTPAALTRLLERFLVDHGAAIVKVDRSSNGSGTVVIRADDPIPLDRRVRDLAGEPPYRACGWVYEEFLPFDAAPSMEMLVEESGVSEFYTCDQRTVDNAWTGMITPAAPRSPYDDLLLAARRIGDWLHDRGYRGIFDLDGGTVADAHVVTEANVRRTGGTYLHELAQRLHGTASPVHWRADVRRGATRMDFHAATATVARAGLADPTAPARVILPVDTLDVDGRWRYLVSGTDASAVAAAERELIRTLELY
ncbi:hypothetical protein ABZ738_30240 [Micromonospora sp. NPDC047793]|uniref:preATP grasp domain-containing protein n=1 Tax=Micromonospora sp. NPDC047793 TaxID=3154342 RepID=UPI0033FBFBBE